MKAVVSSTLLVLVALAGCTSDPDGNVPGTGVDGGADDGPFQLGMPEWQVGDWWTYDSPFGTHTLAVSEEDGTHWMMDTNDPSMAFHHSNVAEISYLGDIRKNDLAGSQPGGPVQFFDWPLEHNKEWRATWDGHSFDMVSHVDESTGVAHIAASIDGTAVNNIVYDSKVGWFRSISWGDPETGDEQFRVDLKDSGSSFAGELVRVDAELVVEESGNGPTAGIQTITIPSHEDADLYLQFTAECPSVVEIVGSAYAFAMGPVENIPGIAGDAGAQNDDGFNHQGQCPESFAFFGVIGEHPGEGTWGYTMDAPDPHVSYSIQLWMRHFERFVL